MPCLLLHDKFEEISEWAEYISVILESNLIDVCCIYNMRGRVLAQSPEGAEEDNCLQDGEAAHMIEALADPQNPRYTSLNLFGHHYNVVINDGKHGILLKSGIRYATICRTSKVLIVGLHKVNSDKDDGSSVIMNLGDFLITKGM